MWGIYKQSVNGKDPEEKEHKKMKKASGEKLSPEQLDVLARELTLSLCIEWKREWHLGWWLWKISFLDYVESFGASWRLPLLLQWG
jgi:hypothetical protein